MPFPSFQYPAYLAANANTLPAPQLEKYTTQSLIVVQILEIFRSPGYKDEDDAQRGKVTKLMTQVCSTGDMSSSSYQTDTRHDRCKISVRRQTKSWVTCRRDWYVRFVPRCRILSNRGPRYLRTLEARVARSCRGEQPGSRDLIRTCLHTRCPSQLP